MTTYTIEQVAAICHEANRALCAQNGDTSQPSWFYVPNWQADSAIAGVKFILANPDAPPSASHESWLAQKVADGWKYGEVKDAAAKTHPCMVPFAELPAHQQAKDHLFGNIVRAMAPFTAQADATLPFDEN